MMVSLKAILPAVLLLAVVFQYGFGESVEAFRNLETEASTCEDGCIKSPDETACARGCRLFSICKWGASNLTDAENECVSACSEAYEGDAVVSSEACFRGCKIARPIAEKQQNQLLSMQPHMHLQYAFPLSRFPDEVGNPFEVFFTEISDHPIMTSADDMMNMMKGSLSKTFSMMNSFLSSSSHGTQIIEVDDGVEHKIIIVEYGNPEINTQHPDDKKIIINTNSGDASKTTLDVESNLQSNVNSKPNFYELSFMSEYGGPEEKSLKQSGCFNSIKDQVQDWWDCFTKKAGLPELVLFLFWLSTMVLLFLTCVSQFYPSNEKLSINGDLAYITDNKDNLPSHVKFYPIPESAKKSPYYLASVVGAREEKVPLLDN